MGVKHSRSVFGDSMPLLACLVYTPVVSFFLLSLCFSEKSTLKAQFSCVFQGTYTPPEKIPETIRSEAEMGPKITGSVSMPEFYLDFYFVCLVL